MNKLQVLTKMILPVEGPVAQSPFLAGRIVVAFDVGLVGIALSAEDAAQLLGIGVDDGRTLGRANPPLE